MRLLVLGFPIAHITIGIPSLSLDYRAVDDTYLPVCLDNF
jgi:hypothetical protein